jgi:hypothetical protein
MNLIHYEDTYKFRKILSIIGIMMIFDEDIYISLVGLFLTIISIFIIWYYNRIINKDDIIIKLVKYTSINNIKELPKKEIKIIDKFRKNYTINNINNINNNNINNIIIININYDDITLFLDILIFVNNIKNIINNNIISNLNIEFIKYYNHYYNIIALITNLNNKDEIITAISNLIDDYNANYKQLYNISKKTFISYNFEESDTIIKQLSNISIDILDKKIDLNSN